MNAGDLPAAMTPGSSTVVRIGRAPFLLLGMLSLLAGLWGGIARLGWPLGPVPAGAITYHGPLMLAGFLGTVIGLERAVVAKSPWTYAAPLFTGSGSLLHLAPGGADAGGTLVALGSLVMTAALARSAWNLPVHWTAAQLLGALCFAAGSVLFATGEPFAHVLPWWQAFLVLTIAGERLELSRLLQPSGTALRLFAGLVALLVAGAVAQSLDGTGLGPRLSGASWLGLALWLGRWDLARKSLSRPGLPRYVAAAILAGHAWLGVAGLLALGFGGVAAGPGYDAVLHALLLGFVFSMIFGHAPLIFPSVLGLPIAFRARFWLHLSLLHAGVLLRVASDLVAWTGGRTSGGLLSAAAILLFLFQTAGSLTGPAEDTG